MTTRPSRKNKTTQPKQMVKSLHSDNPLNNHETRLSQPVSSNTETTIATTTLTERFNIDTAKLIVYNAKELDIEPIQVRLLKKYIRTTHESNGIVSTRITYNHSSYKGRQNPRGSVGLSCLDRRIRGSIAGDLYTDIDIKNCHPVLLIHEYAKTFNLPILTEYVNNREQVLRRFTGGRNRDEVKHIILETMYSSKRYKIEFNEFGTYLKSLYDEMKRLWDYANIAYPDLKRDDDEAELHRSKKSESSMLSKHIQRRETEIMDVVIQHLQSNYDLTDDYVRIHDGCMIPIEVDQELLTSLSDIVHSKLGVRVEFDVKPFETFDLTDMTYQELEYDVTDPYYFSDMLTELRQFNGVPIYDFLDEVYDRIGRVVCCVNGDTFYKKSSERDVFDLFDPIKIRMTFPIKDMKPQRFTQILEFCIADGIIKPYKGVTLIPSIPIQRVVGNYINKFTGFKAKLLPRDQVRMDIIQPVLDHMFHVWADDDEYIQKYYLTWFHQVFNGKRTEIALIFQSIPGAGKSIIMEKFITPHVLGYNCAMDGGLGDITGHSTNGYNDHLVGKVCYTIEELETPTGDYHAIFDQMKRIITGHDMNIQQKYHKMVTVPNHLNLIGFTNNEISIKAEQHDRRYFLQSCNTRYVGNHKYFDHFATLFTPECADHFFSYVYYYDDTVNLKNIPTTKLRQLNIEASLPSPQRFLREGVEQVLLAQDEKDLPDIPYGKPHWYEPFLQLRQHGEIPATYIYNSYVDWCDLNEERKHKNNSVWFGRKCTDQVLHSLGLERFDGRSRKKYYKWIHYDPTVKTPDFIRESRRKW